MCFDGGESISQSATSSPDLFDEKELEFGESGVNVNDIGFEQHVR